jgi:hypothetical protein
MIWEYVERREGFKIGMYVVGRLVGQDRTGIYRTRLQVHPRTRV